MMNKLARLPIGTDDFKELREESFYYVDKTELIELLLNEWNKVSLFARPRRFGKTLNMSMLKAFFEIGTDKSLFEGLYISGKEKLCNDYMGRFPVIFVTLKGVEGLSFEEARQKFVNIIGAEASRHQFLMDSDKLTAEDKERYQAILSLKNGAYSINDGALYRSFKLLSELLYKHYGRKAVILIDEYDVPLDKAFNNGYYREMVSLIRAMFGDALKTNEYLQFAVLTGCMRVSKESIFTGLNNLRVYTVSDVSYNECFGFTDAEVRSMLEYYDLASHHEMMKEWYDGYNFGGQDVYCPWDVINYCSDLRADQTAEPKPYWINTSGNDMLKHLIAESGNGTVQAEIESLIAGETVIKNVNENITHNEVYDSIDNIWSLLYMTGYLTVRERPSRGLYRLCIPNNEICMIFKEQVLTWFKDELRTETDKLTALYTAFETGDKKTITDILNERLLYTVSFYDAYESFYHGFLLALLGTCSNWAVTSNPETGRGRSDIIVWRRDRKIGFAVEVKNVKNDADMSAACSAAMQQIEDRDYTAVLRRYKVKEIWKYGIAFCDKECMVTVDR